MIKNYVIDTNVMIHDPNFLYNFEDNNLIIPITCIEELDSLKKRDGLVGYHARSSAREINNVRSYGNLYQGVKLPNGGTLRIELNHMDLSCLPDGMDTGKNDTRILAITKNIQNENKEIQTVLVTKDLYMSIKGEALGLNVQDYENDKITADEIYKGYADIFLPSSDIDKIFTGGLPFPSYLDERLYPNEFLHIKSIDNISHEVLARFDGRAIVPLKYTSENAWGLYPLNVEQKWHSNF